MEGNWDGCKQFVNTLLHFVGGMLPIREFGWMEGVDSKQWRIEGFIFYEMDGFSNRVAGNGGDLMIRYVQPGRMILDRSLKNLWLDCGGNDLRMLQDHCENLGVKVDMGTGYIFTCYHKRDLGEDDGGWIWAGYLRSSGMDDLKA